LKPLRECESLRTEIGAVTRGGYSQIRGKGIGIALVDKKQLQEIYSQQQEMPDQMGQRFSGKVVLLMRNVNSMNYIPVIC
jgi:glycine cleavage system aminomethyltransferase T